MMGVGTPCNKHGYPYMEPCPICTFEENEALRAMVINLEATITAHEAVWAKCKDALDHYRDALEKIVLSANGFASCTVEYLEVIAEEALKPKP